MVQGQEFVHGADISVGMWEGAGAKGVCVWPPGASSRPTTDGGWMHVPHLPGDSSCISFYWIWIVLSSVHLSKDHSQ